VGLFVFVCVRSGIYLPPSPEPLAGPEQSLCDAVLLMRRAGVAPENLLTFRQLHRLDAKVLKDTALRHPATVRRALGGILEGTFI
jgi:hypothetical protein